jgi:hypothetical protein
VRFSAVTFFGSDRTCAHGLSPRAVGLVHATWVMHEPTRGIDY